MAAPITEPMTAPRRSRGATAMAQARPPPQIRPLAAPWAMRSRSNRTRSSVKPKAAAVTAKAIRPLIVVRRTPARDAVQPPISDPGMIPIA